MGSMKNFLFFGIFLLFGVLLTTTINASVSVGNVSYSIDKSYGVFENIKGWINISLINEMSNSWVSDSFGNYVSLIDLLKSSTGAKYNCSTLDCALDYSASNSETSKNFNLGIQQTKLIGIRFNQNIGSVDSVSFRVNSSASPSYANQLKIDILNNNVSDIGNTKPYFGSDFLKDYGCYNESEATPQYIYIASSNKYCQKVWLYESPAFEIGAWVNNSNNLKASLYNLNGNLAGNNVTCSLPSNQSGGEVFCDISFIVNEKKEYFVCIYPEGANSSKIKGYSKSNGCGFYGAIGNSTPSQLGSAYDIFARGKGFDSFGEKVVSNNLPSGGTINLLVNNYLPSRYGSVGGKIQCSPTKECIVPIKFISSTNQNISVDNFQIKYSVSSLGQIEESNFFDISETSAKINSDFQKIYLDNSDFFVISNQYGNVSYNLKIGNTSIFSTNLVIENIPSIKSLTPTSTASGFPTEFVVLTNASANITKYEWDFGDGETEITSTNEVTHVYSLSGDYELVLTVTDQKNRSASRIFEIEVDSPQGMIETNLNKMQATIDNLTAQITSYDEFTKKSLNNVLGIEGFGDQIKKLKQDFKNAVTEEEFFPIIDGVLELEPTIPNLIYLNKQGDSLLFFPNTEVINLDTLKEITKEDYEVNKEEEYTNSILSWQQQNVELKISFKEISAKYGEESAPVLSVFEIKTKEKQSVGYDYYLIFPKLENLEFKENYHQQDLQDNNYIKFSKPDNTFVLSTSEIIEFSELPFWISPEIRKLDLVEDIPEPEEPKWTGKFILSVVILIVLAVGIYFLMMRWYKYKYEGHLFKDRNNLYNIIVYISDEKKKGILDNEIKSKLKKAGWNSEQVDYAMKKHSGKYSQNNPFQKKDETQMQNRGNFSPKK